MYTKTIKNLYIYNYLYTKFDNIQGPVVPTLVSANPGLNFNPGLLFFSSKLYAKRIKLNLFFKLSIFEFTNPGLS